MFLFNGFKLSTFIIIEFYFLISIKISFADEFIDIKKLSTNNGIYFVVLDKGLFLYDFNNLNCSLIHLFNEVEYLGSNDNISLAELNYRSKSYIFCLINEYLFIFNEFTYKVNNYKINEIIPHQGYYYNIMPYKSENNNISFIITFNNDTNNLYFYFYNFNLNETIIEPKEIIFNNMNIKNIMIRCQINNNFDFVSCFYYSIINDNNYFVAKIFYIKDMNLYLERKIEIINSNLNVINQIKLAMSNNDRYFICILNNTIPLCLINENLFIFEKISCQFNTSSDAQYKVFYFKESNEFMFISRTFLNSIILSSLNNSIRVCKQKIFSKQTNDYSIIYNNEYQLINYTNFSNYLQCINISLLEKIKETEYIGRIKKMIDDSDSKEELIINLNEFIKNEIHIDYIDEKKKL